MTIIIEGTEAVGKTTYAKRLAELNGWEYRHAGPPANPTWNAEYVNPLTRGTDMILDRWHLGELVWPKLIGRPSLFRNDMDFKLCNRLLQIVGVTEIVVLIREDEAIARTMLERGEESTIQQALDAQQLFWEAAERVSYIPVSFYHSNAVQGV